MQDVKLIWLWEKWKQSIADELACDADAADRVHARTQAIEREIAETRAEGLVGIGIQFGLWRFINGHFNVSSDQADAASPLGRSHVRVMSVIHLKADNHQRGLRIRFVP